MLNLKRMNVLPPGGYRYEQPETGFVFRGNDTFKTQCNRILAHRKGNKLTRATFAEVAEDVIAVTCSRLPNLCDSLKLPAPPVIINKPSPAVTPTVPQPTVRFTQPAAPSARKVKKCGSCGGRKAKT